MTAGAAPPPPQAALPAGALCGALADHAVRSPHAQTRALPGRGPPTAVHGVHVCMEVCMAAWVSLDMPCLQTLQCTAAPCAPYVLTNPLRALWIQVRGTVVGTRDLNNVCFRADWHGNPSKACPVRRICTRMMSSRKQRLS